MSSTSKAQTREKKVLVFLVEDEGKGDLAREEGDVAVFVDLRLEAFFSQGIETEFLVHWG